MRIFAGAHRFLAAPCRECFEQGLASAGSFCAGCTLSPEYCSRVYLPLIRQAASIRFRIESFGWPAPRSLTWQEQTALEILIDETNKRDAHEMRPEKRENG